jgi:hypothetical protein
VADAVTEESSTVVPSTAEEALPPAVDVEVAADLPAPASPRSAPAHRTKFLAVYALLAVVFAGGAAGLVALLLQPAAEAGPPWSAWAPGAVTRMDRAAEIADYVSVQYRLPSGSQLVGARAVPLVVQDIPVDAIALEEPTGTPDQNTISFVEASGGLQYILCGLGENCTIAEGESTPERGVLVNREALELALYSFKYVSGIESVLVFRPPRQAAEDEQPEDIPVFALLFQRDNLREQLDVPLGQTFSNPRPPLPDELTQTEIETIDRLSSPYQFLFGGYQQGPDGRLYLLLRDQSLAS